MNKSILRQLAEIMRTATELPWYAAIPLYLIGYGVGLYVFAKGLAAMMELF